jgi:hypothetical protein
MSAVKARPDEMRPPGLICHIYQQRPHAICRGWPEAHMLEVAQLVYPVQIVPQNIEPKRRSNLRPDHTRDDSRIGARHA